MSGVGVLTGGHGLRTFLADLTKDPTGTVAIQTTLNSAGCDHEKMDEMDIEHQGFLEQQFEIIHAYMQLGIKLHFHAPLMTEESKHQKALVLGPNPMQFASPTHTLH